MQGISQFLSDEQDESAIRKIVPRVSELLAHGEQLEYIAVQKRLVVTISPEAIVLTDRRLIVVRPKLLGMTFVDFNWREVKDVHMSEQMIGATIMCTTMSGETVTIDSLPKKQARRVYAYAQQVEEQAYQKRQQVEFDKLRASAGGVVLHAPSPTPQPNPSVDDPMQVLGKLKQLLDAGLIEKQEYDSKKAEILSRL